MDNRSDLIKLGDEDIYLILYLWKVKGCETKELAQRFHISADSVDDLLSGHARRDCYRDFNRIEKYLVETY
ncbi:hypothetical protein BBI15_16060 [Planococcus plakortidis]|uniref:RNA polymerase subunit sigma-70 n=2 Tax=Planococcus TaxID=1372 RepID=A0A1C7ED17_9BACL|nr:MULTISPECIES: hypothetical protein [Planococcus]ANU21585.1 hypothetical protein BBI15_16060 [Planococcus plakortidis]AUD13263.1 hypothetical protein CW734_05610 [Planococcus sp. MB-3u-03]PKG45967.1 hypothetical protein CXF66_09675 [Planococcus sp. Urea-trap-24]PKG89160.1 hypothetical protein CXF91_10080 [Planococcus sp. Urea-3u-39]PKH41667.1 hypothetical protein CXF77_05510 [Planococcus sp. MB-3u-09]